MLAATALALGLVALVMTLKIDLAEAAAPPASCGDMGPTLPDSPGADDYRALLDVAIAYVGSPSHLNRSLGVPTRVALRPEDNARGDGAETVPTYAGDTVTGCTFPIYPTGVSRAVDPAIGTAMLTHEVFHCFLVVPDGP